MSQNPQNFAPHEMPFATIGAGAVVLHRGCVLLSQMNYSEFKGSWILPGGRVELGEHPHQAAQRETREETGVEIEIDGLLACRYRCFERPRSDAYFVFMARLAQLDRFANEFPEVRWPAEELIEARFWPIEEALVAPDVRSQTRLYLKMALEAAPRAFTELAVEPGFYTRDDSIFAPSTFRF